MTLQQSEWTAYKVRLHTNFRKVVLDGRTATADLRFLMAIMTYFSITEFATWLTIILLCSGDIHTIPGPSSSSLSDSISSSSSNMSTNIFSSLNISHNLSFVHYNVQSILPKLEILHAELIDFDILAFTETWLSPMHNTDDLILQSYIKPERKNRFGDSHGGVILYIKEGIHYKRREDLEIRGIESIWIEVANKHKHILFGVFYRPPSADANYNLDIENSLYLADDTDISDIIVTGDFNLNVLNPQMSRKIDSLCTQFSLYQSINQPTHFTEHSSSLIDILLVNNKDQLTVSGVGDPFLNQDVRYHLPIYGIFKFSKPKIKTFTRHVWSYEQGDYDLLRQKASAIDWNSLQNDNIDVHAENINTAIRSLAAECIPNKHVRIKPLGPPWISSTVKRNIRKRKRAYKRAKRTNLDFHWIEFKQIRNRVIKLIRDSKQLHYDKIAEKLKSKTLSTKDWWSTLKSFIIPCTKSSIPPLEVNNDIYTDESDKANLLNNFFQSQTVLNEQNATLPNLPDNTFPNRHLDNIVFSRLEVESVIKTLVTGKASSPNGLSNRILRELSSKLSIPFCSLFNHPYEQVLFLQRTRKQMYVLFPKKVICLLYLTIDLYLC